MTGESLRSHIMLVLGGARSGKSDFAESLVRKSGFAPVYLATGAAFDGEMEERIARHKASRGEGWLTIEEQRDVAGVLDRESRAERAILIDCLTLWLSNLMFAEADIEAETMRLIKALANAKGPVVLVSNEVGGGIVPDNALARRFRDEQGRLNRRVAEAADTVVLVAAGLPLLMKPNPDQPEIRL
ncbi:bifunctional adenosylcobinamide kinase/adenosylcobinamide-phosphate guanylyltransferase [Stappia sp. F7233]|uniref:Bifunctional adenosylcobalamin biosynthesis protein n=1 Tax=Stappia albiluteola TaxID=2758565 RepID=A0A839AB86_9HYPH|nr:bifunctional adenosylcobinamide kinase/adenosylcobinamide-phosphate guanylyltransferase [Stappia albiluteola]MBA5776446.1 bifunctional adenosylcobinamide kinase/adenosylcobinamide-phosphate guanylyltransferase [Stappia albiluteola]